MGGRHNRGARADTGRLKAGGRAKQIRKVGKFTHETPFEGLVNSWKVSSIKPSSYCLRHHGDVGRRTTERLALGQSERTNPHQACRTPCTCDRTPLRVQTAPPSRSANSDCFRPPLMLMGMPLNSATTNSKKSKPLTFSRPGMLP